MQRKEFNRQIIELRQVIADAIVYLTGWQGLMVQDDDSAQALNRYRGLFLTARNAMQWSALMQLAIIFDKDTRTISLRNLLIAAQSNPNDLTPNITDEDLTSIEHQIEEKEPILENLKRFRDQRLAHWDANVTGDVKLLLGDIKRLLEDTISMYSILLRGHEGSSVNYDRLIRTTEWHTSKIVSIMCEERDRDEQKIKDAEKLISDSENQIDDNIIG